MDRNELTTVIAAALVFAVLLGWVLRWIFSHMNGTGPRSVKRTVVMAEQLHAAEEARHAAEKRLSEVETDLKARLTERESELTSALDSLTLAREEVEQVRAAYRRALAEAPRDDQTGAAPR